MKNAIKAAAVAIALAATTLGASAQSSIFNNPSNRSYLGVRLGLDVTCPQPIKFNTLPSIDFLKPGAGVELGLIYNIPIIANFYVEPGVMFYYDTFIPDDIEIGSEDTGFDTNDAYEHNSIRKFGFRIPVQLGYHFDFTNSISAKVFTGPVLDTGFSNDYYVTTKPVAGVKYHESGTLYRDKAPRWNRVNCSWRFGGGVNINNISVELSGDVGMVNMYDTGIKSTKYYENCFHLTIGYNI